MPRRTTVPLHPGTVAAGGGIIVSSRAVTGDATCAAGSYIGDPPSAFCDYFDCIASFWESTNGYVMQCDDGMYSHSGGRSGSCSHHGGNNRPLYG